MPKIAVLDYRLHPDAQEVIQTLASNKVTFYTDRCPEDQRIARTGDADIVLVTPWEKVDAQYLDACPSIQYIGLCGTSTANIDLEELTKRKITFSNIVSGDKESVAEFFLYQLVGLARGTGEHQWKQGEEHELVGVTLGIVGLGKVGQAIAHLALAFKMHVIYYSPNRKKDWEDKGVKYMPKDELIKSSAIVALCSTTNVKVMGATEFGLLGPGSILIQACAGSPFEKEAFLNWIAIAGNFAIFDMSAGEHNYQAYKNIPRVIFSRQVAGDTYESNARRGQRAIKNLQQFLKTPGTG